MKLTKLLLNEIVSSNIYDTKCKLTTNDGGSSNYRLCCVLEVSFFQFEFLYNLHLVFVVYVFLCVCVCVVVLVLRLLLLAVVFALICI